MWLMAVLPVVVLDTCPTFPERHLAAGLIFDVGAHGTEPCVMRETHRHDEAFLETDAYTKGHVGIGTVNYELAHMAQDDILDYI